MDQQSNYHFQSGLVGSAYICHLCRGPHYYSQCPSFRGDCVCFYSERDENMYMMHHPYWPRATMRDIFLFISKMMGLMPHQVQLLVGDVDINASMWRLNQDLPCANAYVVPGVTVSVLLVERYKFLARSGGGLTTAPPPPTVFNANHKKEPVAEEEAPQSSSTMALMGSVASSMPSSVPAGESPNMSLPVPSAAADESVESVHQQQEEKQEEHGKVEAPRLQENATMSRLMKRMLGRNWADISSDTAATGESPQVQRPESLRVTRQADADPAASAPKSQGSVNQVFVYLVGFPASFTQGDFAKMLEPFKPTGLTLKAPRANGKGKYPFGFAGFPSEQEAWSCINALDSTVIDGQTVRAAMAKTPSSSSSPLGNGGRASQQEEENGKKIQRQIGRRDPQSAAAALIKGKVKTGAPTTKQEEPSRHSTKESKKTSSAPVKQKKPSAADEEQDERDKGNALLHINYIPVGTTEAELGGILQSFGKLVSFRLVVPRSTTGDKVQPFSFWYGFAEYASNEDANQCREKLNGKPMGSKTLRVSWADTANSNSSRHNSKDDKKSTTAAAKVPQLSPTLTQGKKMMTKEKTNRKQEGVGEDKTKARPKILSRNTTMQFDEQPARAQAQQQGSSSPIPPTSGAETTPRPRTPQTTSNASRLPCTPMTEPPAKRPEHHRQGSHAIIASIRVMPDLRQEEEEELSQLLGDIVSGAERCSRDLVGIATRSVDGTKNHHQGSEEEEQEEVHVHAMKLERQRRVTSTYLSNAISSLKELLTSSTSLSLPQTAAAEEETSNVSSLLARARCENLGKLQHVRLLRIASILSSSSSSSVLSAAAASEDKKAASVVVLDLLTDAQTLCESLMKVIIGTRGSSLSATATSARSATPASQPPPPPRPALENALAKLSHQLIFAGLLFEGADMSISKLCYDRGTLLMETFLPPGSHHVRALKELMGKRPLTGGLLGVVLPGLTTCTWLYLAGRVQIVLYPQPPQATSTAALAY